MSSTWDIKTIATEQGDFLYRSLQRLGVRDADLSDLMQEVLIITHKRLHTYDPNRAKITTWLFGICSNVASNARRKAYNRREVPSDLSRQDEVSEQNPETSMQRKQQSLSVAQVLDELPAKKRAVLVMFEIEGKTCEEIAELLDVPVGTVHSRLHTARTAFKAAFTRMKAQDRVGVAS